MLLRCLFYAFYLISAAFWRTREFHAVKADVPKSRRTAQWMSRYLCVRISTSALGWFTALKSREIWHDEHCEEGKTFGLQGLQSQM